MANPVEPFPTEGAIYDPDAVTGAQNITIGKRTHQTNVYPNPLSKNDILKIDFGGDMTASKEVRIIDASGAILYVQQEISEPTYEIPLEARLGQGIYFVNIKTHEWRETQKFMVQ